ncbi:hypothetical protein MTO96_039294 [Rhipicephalus appendiculatus]
MSANVRVEVSLCWRRRISFCLFRGFHGNRSARSFLTHPRQLVARPRSSQITGRQRGDAVRFAPVAADSRPRRVLAQPFFMVDHVTLLFGRALRPP